MIEGLHVHCHFGVRREAPGEPWQLDTSRCTEVVARSEQGRHKKVCNYRPARCKWIRHGCPWQGFRKDEAQHMTQCGHEEFKVQLRKLAEVSEQQVTNFRTIEEQTRKMEAMRAEQGRKQTEMDQAREVPIAS